MRRKSTDENVSFCPRCAREVQQMLAQKRAQPASPPPPSPSLVPPPATPRQAPAPPGATPTSASIPIGGVLLLLLLILLAGPLLGAVVALVSYHFIYLIIAFPLVMGWAGGYVMAQGVWWGKVRDAVIAAAFGLLLGLCVYGSYRYIEYRLVRNEVRADIVKELETEFGADIVKEMEAEFGMSGEAMADEFFDEILLEETGQTGFLGVVLLDAQEGMSISPTRYGSSTEGLNIGTPLTWLYWLFEIVAIAGIAAYTASESAQKPFCERHDRWYTKERSLGGVEPAQIENVLGLLEGGEYPSFGRALHQKAPVPGVEFFIERCVGCQDSEPVLTIKTVKRSSRGRAEYDVIGKQTLTPAQGEQILESVYAQGRKTL
jgi:hypothetical protein